MTTQAISSTGTATAAGSNVSNMSKIDPQEFLKIMIKEMQQQDPFQPVSSKDLISQVGQIRDIQTNLDLSKTLKDLAISQKLTSASALLGKQITGLDSTGQSVSGLVTSVKREGDYVYLELDSGQQLSIDNVLAVNNNATAAPTTTATTQ